MPLAKSCKTDFSATTRNKGDAYYRQGRVTNIKLAGSTVQAQVRGSDRQPYKVEFDWSDPGDGILATCTCPHYDGGNFCKHIWAMVLAADEQGVAMPDVSRSTLVHSLNEYDYDEAYDDDYDDDYNDEPIGTARDVWRRATALLKESGRQTGKSGKSPAWHSLLGRNDGASLKPNPLASANARPKLVKYVIDVAASFQAGAIVINLFQQEQRKDGQWGKAKVLKASRDKLDQFSPADQRRLALLLGNYAGEPWSRTVPLHAQSYQQASQVELVPALHEWLLPEMCGDQCLGWVLGSDQPVEDCRLLAWDDGMPWEFRLVIEDDAEQKTWTIRGELVQGECIALLGEPVLLLSSGLVMFEDRLARLSPTEDWRWLSTLRATNQLTVPHADRQRLLSELWASGEPRVAAVPVNLRIEPEIAPPRGCLKIHAPKKSPYGFGSSANPGVMYADVLFDYAGQQITWSETRGVVFDQAHDRVVLRDRNCEDRLWGELVGSGMTLARPNYYQQQTGDLQFPQQQFNRIVDQLVPRGWQVWAEGKLFKRAGEFRVAVQSGVDWFDLDAHVDFEGCQATLPQLLAALKNNERFVLLDDGSRGILPQEWLERFTPLAELAEVEGDRIRFRPSQALLLDALLDERWPEVAVQADRQFSRLRDKLRSFDGVKPREAPAAFRGELRPYQKQGLGWIAFLEEFSLNGCLADDMGLGKTVQVLAWLAARPRRSKLPTLIVAPKSVVLNWQLEAERFTPRLKVLNYTGLGRDSLAADIPESHLVITTYGTLRRDIDVLKDVQFDYAILDEAQAIKNDRSVSAKACRLLRADHRLALTGTPVENHLGDLWSIFEFLNPGMLGRSNALRSYTQTNGDDTAALDTLRRGLAPFILRRTKQQVLPDLPEKNEQTLPIELLPADRKRYNELRDYYRNSLLKRVSDSGMNRARMHVLEALLRLRQTACHSGLVDKNLVANPSAKLEALVENVAEVIDEGHKALVFSQFTSLLSIVKQSLNQRGFQYEYLDGRTRDRQQRIDRFQSDPACSLFLISLKAGGTGLNLTAADYVFLLDPWWNPAVESQAIDRAHRIGQQRPVFAYRLVARDTVEEKIIELQLKKRELADAIISGDKSPMAGLTVEDLQLLLS